MDIYKYGKMLREPLVSELGATQLVKTKSNSWKIWSCSYISISQKPGNM